MGPLVLIQTDQLYMRFFFFPLAFRLHIWDRVNFVVLVHYVYYVNVENMAKYNHSNLREETCE